MANFLHLPDQLVRPEDEKEEEEEEEDTEDVAGVNIVGNAQMESSLRKSDNNEECWSFWELELICYTKSKIQGVERKQKD